jgi:chromosome partitioning protein
MRVLALMNQKGGVGKTTTTVNLGAALAEAGKRILLIDLDPQAHLTINYGVEPSPQIKSIYDVLVDENGSLLEAVQQIEERIALVPASIDLAAAEIELVSVLGREMLLKKRIESALGAAGGQAGLEFDYILLDCPPSLGLLTINALAVATEVIIPMQPHFLALQGVGKLLETVRDRADAVRFASQAEHRGGERSAGLHRLGPRQEPAVERCADLRIEDPPQHQAGREPELRAEHPQVRPDEPWRQ